MKKLLTIIIFLTGSYVFAQQQTQTTVTTTTTTQVQPVPQKPVSQGPSVRLNAYANYAFDDNHVDSYYSETSYFDGAIKGGFLYGGGLEVMLHQAYGLELTYLRLDSKAPMEYYGNNGITHTNFDLATNYIMIGGNRYVKTGKVEPYGGMMLGMAIFNIDNPDNNKSGSATKFAWGIKLGANVWASEKMAIKLQASLLSAVQAVGGGVYFGTGGAGAGVSGFSSFYQFVLGGGLVFNLERK